MSWMRAADPYTMNDHHHIRTIYFHRILIASCVALLAGGCPVNEALPPVDPTNPTQTPGGDPTSDVSQPPPPAPSDPQISVQFESSIPAGSRGTLDASASSDADGDALSFFWEQTGGLSVMLSDVTAPVATFVAPQVLVAETLAFRLRVSDGKKTIERTLTIVVTPGPFHGARTSWVADTENMNADIHWRLPSRAFLEAERAGWGPTGLEWIVMNPSVIPNGRHDIAYELSGAGRTGTIAFAMNLFNYSFATSARLMGDKYRTIAIDVLDGEAVPLFNGWLAAEETGAGGITGRYDLELLGAWRAADESNYYTELNLMLPNGDWAGVERAGWAPQGLERIAFARETPLADGNYSIISETHGNGRTASVSFHYKLLNFGFSTRQSMLGGERRIIGLDVRNGVANVLFNGWLSAGESGAGGLTSQRPLQAIGAWREGSDDVHVDVNIQMPNGTYLDERGVSGGRQGYAHIYLDGVTLPDGIYRFSMSLNGGGRTGRVTYRAKLLNWQFERTEVMLGGTQREIQVWIANGVVTQVNSNW